MAINLTELKTELTTDPMGLGLSSSYSTGNDASCAGILNEVREGVNYEKRRNLIPSYEVVGSIVPSEWTSLSADEKERISFIVSAGEINPNSTNVVTAFTTAFTSGSSTRTNILGILNEQTSRAQMLFSQSVSITDVSATRKL